jgi:hypothetical protein
VQKNVLTEIHKPVAAGSAFWNTDGHAQGQGHIAFGPFFQLALYCNVIFLSQSQV